MLHVANLTPPVACVFEAVLVVLEVVEGLLQLFFSREDERTVVCDRLVQRLPSKQDETGVGCSRLDRNIFVCACICHEGDGMRSSLCSLPLHLKSSFVKNNHAVPACRDSVLVGFANLLKDKVDEISGSASDYWSTNTENVTSHYFCFHTSAIVVYWNRV